ncbi:hypothetical protein P692DRAFT_201873433 [Suillus brevipes Sb2]|nr:hypothetical protein P692DRAFT_201873433 [Suillus brevipes Sb2]
MTAPSHISVSTRHLEPIQTNALSTSFEVQYEKLRLPAAASHSIMAGSTVIHPPSPTPSASSVSGSHSPSSSPHRVRPTGRGKLTILERLMEIAWLPHGVIHYTFPLVLADLLWLREVFPPPPSALLTARHRLEWWSAPNLALKNSDGPSQKAKRQGLGLIEFIGELFKLQMLTERIMHEFVPSVGQCTTDLHSESMIHITVLTFFSSVLHLGAAILPSSYSISARNLQAFPPSLAFWHSMTVSYTLTFAIFATTTLNHTRTSASDEKNDKKLNTADGEKGEEENEFSSKAQVMTLMTTDVDRVTEFSYHLFALADSPIKIVLETTLLYSMLGVSSFIGLAVICLFLLLNHLAGKVGISTQDNLIKARGERVSLINEILGGICMLKRSFEKRVMTIRERELKYQKLNYRIEVMFAAICFFLALRGLASADIVSLYRIHICIYYLHGTQAKPGIVFNEMRFAIVFNEMRFAINALPETFINLLQVHVSLKRIGKYLQLTEVAPVPPLSAAPAINTIAVQSTNITWPHDRSADSSAASTPWHNSEKLSDQITVLVAISLLYQHDVIGRYRACRIPP